MRLVASGMSDKEIGRHLKVAPATIKARLDRISAQFKIKNRTELATFALSRLFGGIGALAALIWAALEDIQDANAAAIGHADADSVTVTAADGHGAQVTIKITPQKTIAALGKTAKAVSNVGRVERLAADMPTPASKPIESRADIAGSTIAVPTLTPPGSGVSSFATFMMTAVGVLIYEFFNSPAQAFNAHESLDDLFASAAANGTSELAALNSPGIADAKLGGLGSLAWLNPEVHHDAFVFDAAQSDPNGRHDEVQTIDAAWSDGSADGNGNAHVGAGAIDALTEQSGFEQVAAADPSMGPGHDTPGVSAGDGPDREPSQRDLHVSEQGAAAGKPHAEQEPRGHDANHGKSQADAPPSEDAAVPAQQHGKHAGNEPNPGQSHRDLISSEHSSATPGQHVGDDGPGSHGKSAQSQRDVHEAHSNAAKNPHAGPDQNAGDNGHASDASGPVQTTAPPERGDSFHFKNDKAEAKASDHFEDGHGPDTTEHALHHAENNGLARIPDADLIGPSHAEPTTVDHAKAIGHHLAHDLFV